MIDEQDDFDGVSADTYGVVEYYGTLELRWFQVAARNALAAALEKGHKRILIKQPTGAGKTLTIACSMAFPRIRKALGVKEGKKMRVLFVSHKHRLLSQAEAAFANASEVELIPQSMFSDIPADLLKKGWDITVLDECHREACATFQFQLEKLGKHQIIGLTATDNRADGMLIKFEKIIEPITREQAVEEGYLARTYLNSVVDTADTNKVPITKMVIDKYAKEFGQMMMFFRTKKEVVAITDYLISKKYKAVAILSQSDAEVDDILNRFSDGKIQFICNCNKINEGVDVRRCEAVFLGRSYGSYPQLNQVIGRAARPDSPCNVWELVNPLSGRNLDTTVVVGTPELHRLISRRKGNWVEQEFDYVHHSNQLDVSNTHRR